MKTNCCDDINKLLEIPDLIVKDLEIKEKEVIIHGQCMDETQCPHCGNENLELYKGKDKKIRHLDVCGKRCYISFRHSSYRCKKCGLHFITQVSFLKRTKHYSDHFVKHVVNIARGSSLVHTSEFVGEPYSNIERMYYTYLLEEQAKDKPDWQQTYRY